MIHVLAVSRQSTHMIPAASDADYDGRHRKEFNNNLWVALKVVLKTECTATARACRTNP
jgi:hypothetical protein